METKHTPGPWQVHGSHVYSSDPERELISMIWTPGRNSKACTIMPNAALIAAAPELLDALRTIMADGAVHEVITGTALRKANTAIAKATTSNELR